MLQFKTNYPADRWLQNRCLLLSANGDTLCAVCVQVIQEHETCGMCGTEFKVIAYTAWDTRQSLHEVLHEAGTLFPNLEFIGIAETDPFRLIIEVG